MRRHDRGALIKRRLLAFFFFWYYFLLPSPFDVAQHPKGVGRPRQKRLTRARRDKPDVRYGEHVAGDVAV